jgi:hypothetical protein
MRGQIEAVRDYNSRAMAVAAAGQMLEYLGTANANLAWVAWREERLPDGQLNGRAALELWRKTSLVYPFQWTALWPLIGTALAQNQVSEAIDCARQLLEPGQQRLPDTLAAAIEESIAAWDQGHTQTAHTRLHGTLGLAQEMGYV